MTAAPTAPDERGRRAVATAAGQVFVLLGASLIAVVVTATLAPGARLDAYFAASQVAVAALFLGQGLRTTVPGLAVSGLVTVPVLARATVFLLVGVGLSLVAAALVTPLLLPGSAQAPMRRDLLILVPGALAQVAGGYAAGRVAMAGRFSGVAVAYALGTLLNGVLLAVLLSQQGAALLAPAALVGWLTSAAIIAVLLFRARLVDHAVVPREATKLGVRAALGRILLSIAPVLAAQAVVVIAVTAGAHLQRGGSTLISLAVLALNAVATVAVGPIPVVLSADYGATWDRRAESLVPTMLAVVRLSAAVMMPLVLVLVLVGEPIAGLALKGLSARDVDQLFTLIVILLPSLPLTAAGMVGLVAVLALDRLTRNAVAVTVVALMFAFVAAAATTTDMGLVGFSALLSVAAGSLAVAGLMVPLGRLTLATVAAILFAAGRVAAPSVGVLIAAWLLSTPALESGLAWAALGGVLHLLWIRLVSNDEYRLLLGVVRRG